MATRSTARPQSVRSGSPGWRLDVGRLNCRDLGGLRFRDGTRIAPGTVYRLAFDAAPVRFDLGSSGSLIDPRPLQIFDLRSESERPPDVRPVGVGSVVIHRYPLHDAGLSTVPLAERGVPEFRAHYLRLVEPAAPIVAYMVRWLARGSTRVAFGCRLGKDRTGLVALLLLTVLGVRRRDVVQDFALTARAFRRAECWLKIYAHEHAEPARDVLRRCSLPATLADDVLDELARRVGTGTALVEYLGLDPAEAERARLMSACGW